MRTVTKAFLRYLPRRRGLSFLQVLGIACGVAAAVGMAFSSRAALSSFSQAVDFLRGRTTHTLERPAGPMEETLLTRLMRDPSVRAFSPVIDRRIQLSTGAVVRLLGVDPFLDRALRPELADVRFQEGPDGGSERALAFLLEEKTVLVDAGLAHEMDSKVGDVLETSHGDVRVVGVFPNPSGEPLILMDVAQAQRVFGLEGRLDRVDLILEEDEGFRLRWGEGFVIQTSRQRQSTFSDMLRAFRLNLEALSLIALFVGVFLIYNTAMFAVISRRRDAGILRGLGARRDEIIVAFLTEILVLGALGGALGGILGYLLSRVLTGLVGGTISSLYFFIKPVPPSWSWWVPLAGGIGGCTVSLLGGLFPLLELLRVDPVRAIQGRVPRPEGRVATARSALAGLVVLGLSLGVMVVESQHVYAGFAGAFGLLVGASLLTGLALAMGGPALKWGLGRLCGLPGKVAAGNIRENLGRTAVAVAAFMVALGMSIGMGSMIGSFRSTLVWWMDSQLQGDLYVAPSREVEVPAGFYDQIRSIDGIGGLDPYRNLKIMYEGTSVYVSSIDAAVLQKYTRFGWVEGGNENWEPVKRGGVVVSESFSRRFGAGPGDTITLQGVHGPVELEVAAVFYDYTTEHGLIMMDRSTYLDAFADATIDSLAVFMDPDHPRRLEILQKVKEIAAQWGLTVSPRAQFQEGILELFDATFAVTRSMRMLAVIVAFFGIAGALLTLYMERQREFGIYRALGFSTSQVAGVTLMEGLGMGIVSFILSTGVGTALALVLIRVINLRSFHWTIFYDFQVTPYLIAAVTAILASLGASAYPMWRVCRTYPQMQIREE